jgi:uncharacterized Zn finger protein
MPDFDAKQLESLVRRTWSAKPTPKAQEYIDTFFDNMVVENRIVAKVQGNHGTYTVSVELKDKKLTAACSCYIGKGGLCHHCHALALTYLRNPSKFSEVQPKTREDVKQVSDLQAYLQSMTLESLLDKLKEHRITQKAFAESIGMNPRHLAAIKSSEARNHYFNELGATKLACLWLLDHVEEFKGR